MRLRKQITVICELTSDGLELVGERGFEPPTPWSRTRCSTRLSHSPTLPLRHAGRMATETTSKLYISYLRVLRMMMRYAGGIGLASKTQQSSPVPSGPCSRRQPTH